MEGILYPELLMIPRLTSHRHQTKPSRSLFLPALIYSLFYLYIVLFWSLVAIQLAFFYAPEWAGVVRHRNIIASVVKHMMKDRL